MENICEIKSGVRLTKKNMNKGFIPFIGATDSNNGITNYVSNINSSLDKNVLGVNYNGSVVSNFYHPYYCIFSDDVKRLSFIDKYANNKNCFLFLKQMIIQQKGKYKYGYKFNGKRMSRQKILLPIDKMKNVDYETMESFIAVKEAKKVLNVIKYFS